MSPQLWRNQIFMVAPRLRFLMFYIYIKFNLQESEHLENMKTEEWRVEFIYLNKCRFVFGWKKGFDGDDHAQPEHGAEIFEEGTTEVISLRAGDYFVVCSSLLIWMDTAMRPCLTGRGLMLDLSGRACFYFLRTFGYPIKQSFQNAGLFRLRLRRLAV